MILNLSFPYIIIPAAHKGIRLSTEFFENVGEHSVALGLFDELETDITGPFQISLLSLTIRPVPTFLYVLLPNKVIVSLLIIKTFTIKIEGE